MKVLIHIQALLFSSQALFIFLLLCPSVVRGQINIDTSTYTPQQLVQDVLIGQGVTASNISYTGTNESIAYFSNGGTTNLGLDSGLVICNGDVNLIPVQGTNIPNAGANLGLPGHPLLESLIPGFTTYDAVYITFDFIPVSDTIRFRYVFGSEEYPEFVNSSFNDVFGFFITGGIDPNTGTLYNNENIALIPGTNIPVAIDNVNNGSTNTGPCVNCQYYINNDNGMTIEYDGLTTVLEAWARVIPCTQYSIFIGIADAGDAIYDSGVFLEAYSFTSDPILIERSYTNTAVDTLAIENCNDVTVTFRLPQPIGSNTSIPLTYTGTAQAGVDYDPLPSSIIIPAGSDSASITISAIPGGITGTKTLNIIYPVNCKADTVSVTLRQQDPLTTTTTPDTTLCTGAATLNVQGQDGAPPYTYNWNTGDTTSVIGINPATHTTYTVTTTDLCGQTSEDTIQVSVSTPVISPLNDSICAGDTAFLSAHLPGAQSYLWETGDTTATLAVSPPSTTGYTVTVTDTLGCPGTDTVYAVVHPNPNLTTSPDTTICEGGTATLQAHGAQLYEWSNGNTGQTINVLPTSDQFYQVVGTSHYGCKDTAEINVYINTYPSPSILADRDTICRGESIQLTAQGGDHFQWSHGETGPNTTVSPDETKQYTVTASNILNGTYCSADATITLAVVRCNTYFVPNAFNPTGSGYNDTFGPVGQFKNIEYYQFHIFDRWGNLVFQTGDYDEKWDGTGRGNEPLPPGTYVYKIKITEGSFEPITLQGTVILMR